MVKKIFDYWKNKAKPHFPFDHAYSNNDNGVMSNFSYNNANQLVSELSGTLNKIYSYDLNGNLTRVTAKNGNGKNKFAIETFTYRGAEWHRASLQAAGKKKIKFLYDGDNVIADIVKGKVRAEYVTPFLDQNVSMTQGNKTYYYTQDGLGSVRTLTDAAGQIKNIYDYSAFGSVAPTGTKETIPNRYTYTGRELNPKSGNMFYRYRTYNSELAEFISRDPLYYEGSPDANLYSYVFNSPTIYTDPYGKGWIWDLIKNVWKWASGGKKKINTVTKTIDCLIAIQELRNISDNPPRQGKCESDVDYLIRKKIWQVDGVRAAQKAGRACASSVTGP